jgi:hypothetical protein
MDGEDTVADQKQGALVPLPRSQRGFAVVLGALASVTGGVAVFRTSNGAGTTALLIVGAFFLLIGSLGVLPVRLKIGDNELTLAQTAKTLRAIGTVSGASPLDALRDLAVKYETIRESLAGSAQRTVLLEGVLLQARSLATSVPGDDLTDRLKAFETDPPGRRVITLALLEGTRRVPDHAYDVLAAGIARPASNFEQYHALHAAVELINNLPTTSQRALCQAAQNYLNDPKTDRARPSQARPAAD